MPRLLMLLGSIVLLGGCGQSDVAVSDNDRSQEPSTSSPQSADRNAGPDESSVREATGGTATGADRETTTPEPAVPNGTASGAAPVSPPTTSETDSIESLLQRVGSQMQFNNTVGALATLDEILKQAPDHPQALAMLGMAAQQRGITLAQQDRMSGNDMLLKSAQAFRRLKELNQLPAPLVPQLANALYNEACSLALMGETDRALESLQGSLDAGFDDLTLLADDQDFASLRDNETFQKIVAGASAGAAERKMEMVREQLASFESFPFQMQLNNLKDEPVSLDDFKGKVVIVDVWGTWCPPCRQEIPHFVKLYNEYKDKGFEIVGINYERVPEDQVKPTIQKFVEQEGVNYTCVIGDDATRTQIPEFEGYPTTLFVDRQGKVRLKLVGYSEYAELEGIVKLLLEESAE